MEIMKNVYFYQSSGKKSPSVMRLISQLKDVCIDSIRINPKTKVFPTPEEGLLLNWGCGTVPKWWVPTANFEGFLNYPGQVNLAQDKRGTLEALKSNGVRCLQFTTNTDVARNWINRGHKVFARRLLRASGGRGITVYDNVNGVPLGADFRLYTRRFPKTHEFRVHIFKGACIIYSEKRHTKGVVPTNRDVRNLGSGWIYCNDDVRLSGHIIKLAQQAVTALKLDFGAVDILATLAPADETGNRRIKRAVVCEVNTAPGLINTMSTRAYVTAIREML